jgi:hypothetical protein
MFYALRVALLSRPHVLKLPPEWAAPGVYVLVGPLGADAPTQLYIGKAVKVRKRLNDHRNAPKLPWWRALAVIRDTTAGFNSAEIGYLEGRLTSELSSHPKISVKAEKNDQDTTIPILRAPRA